MDKKESPGPIAELISGIFEMIGVIFEAIVEIAPKAISFILWALLAILILPCVFVAGTIYPYWVEWGEEL